MSLQIIKSVEGKDEYVLLPIAVYQVLHAQIDKKISQLEATDDYVPFDPADYVDNPVALARLQTGMTQKELAKRLNVSQAYISKIERQEKVTAKLMAKVKIAIKQ